MDQRAREQGPSLTTPPSQCSVSANLTSAFHRFGFYQKVPISHCLVEFSQHQMSSLLRFVNARAEAAMNAQKVTTAKLLYNIWITISELRNSVTMKGIKLQQLRGKTSLVPFSEDRCYICKNGHCWKEIIRQVLYQELLKLDAATLRLPVTGGARVDIQALKEVVSSAVDVMQAKGSSICSLLPKVERMNHLVSELAEVVAQEKALLDECVDFFSYNNNINGGRGIQFEVHPIQLKQGRCWGLEKSMDSGAVAVDFGQRNLT